jgi:protein involved in polysaccharide export with SLBB domain
LPRVGDLEASNRTPLEMRDSIAQQLKEYMMNSVVTVIVAGSQPATASSRSINSRSVVSHR